jgi:hypothetical protein
MWHFILFRQTRLHVVQWRTEGVFWGFKPPPRNTKLQLSPEPLPRGPLPPDPRSLCPLSSAEFVEPHKIPGYATDVVCTLCA